MHYFFFFLVQNQEAVEENFLETFTPIKTIQASNQDSSKAVSCKLELMENRQHGSR